MKTYTYLSQRQGRIIEEWCWIHCPNAQLEKIKETVATTDTFASMTKYRFTFPDPKEETLFMLRWA